MGSRARLQKMAEDGVPFDERKFGMGQGLRPQLVNFVRSERILIKDVKMINSPFWVMHPLLCKDITVDGVTVWNEGPNGDGCDPEACENVLIRTVSSTPATTASPSRADETTTVVWNKPSKNIIIRNCRMEDGHGGVVISSEISGGCENVYAGTARWILLTWSASSHQDQQLLQRTHPEHPHAQGYRRTV